MKILGKKEESNFKYKENNSQLRTDRIDPESNDLDDDIEIVIED